MYLAHFGLTEPPFKITPHPDFFYAGAQRGATLEALLYAVTSGEGIVKVVGEVGSGKTMLCRMLIDRLPATVDLVYLANPNISADDILFAIADELKLPWDATRPMQAMKQLQACLIDKYAANRQVVVLIDEAHAMPPDSLERVRLLSNLENGHHKLLQMVLFGQPELDQNLSLPDMRQLRERIVHQFELAPLAGRDVGEYLRFRLRAAGYKGPDNFARQAIRLIANESEGLTRRINILADKALLAAFADGAFAIQAKHARQAIRDSGFRRPKVPWSRVAWVGGSVTLGLLLGLGMRAMSTDLPTSRIEPPPMVAPTALPRPALNTGIVEARLQAATDWLLSAPAGFFTIQLISMVESTPDQLSGELKRIALTLDQTKLYVTQSDMQGRPGYVVYYGSFSNRAEALDALAALPDAVRADKPVLRTLAGVRRNG
ncbi:type II secretory pathway predicted ATPase ExeA [Chitinivorax tropicus]|uniref:Type II secretory pathway predicted ATPase ExeA n=1 Tax=Chitinivorax tropicus TaxID=714531 RepID=A0A840MM39_9PROT|nr:AAA family ATPase [Chitinivorax tropicus]MBB5019480.1 type II secretory pathway predicted ATPase ExeA [Chitinivorax tropicus]